MKTISGILAAALFTTAASAQAPAHKEMTLRVNCWDVDTLIKVIEAKVFRLGRYYEAGFKGSAGFMAEVIDPEKRKLIWFAIEGKNACMVAIANADMDDMKRVALK